ncbi:hypothetical protein CANARDRAFT_5877 [[Candida] arabinofermentans NRRL YB-2248]|uniref:Zn(2)-C6 fungal-type domain-containing protein n=1 Tax=[Candida] arabinofermentans NRRL YB-2248 TaxID=983967 RepID=A0A1E4T6E5_9ASCO|nr:hypothetical protein CANARDRAFT_5877 [[Candida] arabinofermentans NRRL YB-2248]
MVPPWNATSGSSASESNHTKKTRSSIACTFCRYRKVKCDVNIQNPELSTKILDEEIRPSVPCSFCIKHKMDCLVPESKRRKFTKEEPPVAKQSTGTPSENDSDHTFLYPRTINLPQHIKVPSMEMLSSISIDISTFNAKPPAARDTRNNSSNEVVSPSLIDRVRQKIDVAEKVLPLSSDDLGHMSYKMIDGAGCLLLPQEDICWIYINAYFDHFHAKVPVVNKTAFYRDYSNVREPPSLLLLHCVILLGAIHYDEPDWTDADRTKKREAIKVLEKRSQIIYQLDLESDPLCLCQCLLLFGWFWEDLTLTEINIFYWTRLALIHAYSINLHKDCTDDPTMTTSQKRMYRRVWWMIYIEERLASLCYGRPFVISDDQIQVPDLTPDDFKEDDEESGTPFGIPPIQFHVDYILNMASLCKLIEKVVRLQGIMVKEEFATQDFIPTLQYNDNLLHTWFERLPKSLKYDEKEDEIRNDNDRILVCCLSGFYNTFLSLIHRSNLLRLTRTFPRLNYEECISPLIAKEPDDLYSSSMIVYSCCVATSKMIGFLTRSGRIYTVPPLLCFCTHVTSIQLMVFELLTYGFLEKATISYVDVFLDGLKEITKSWPQSHFTYYVCSFLRSNRLYQIEHTLRWFELTNKIAIENNDFESQAGSLHYIQILGEKAKQYIHQKKVEEFPLHDLNTGNAVDALPNDQVLANLADLQQHELGIELSIPTSVDTKGEGFDLNEKFQKTLILKSGYIDPEFNDLQQLSSLPMLGELDQQHLQDPHNYQQYDQQLHHQQLQHELQDQQQLHVQQQDTPPSTQQNYNGVVQDTPFHLPVSSSSGESSQFSTHMEIINEMLQQIDQPALYPNPFIFGANIPSEMYTPERKFNPYAISLNPDGSPFR